MADLSIVIGSLRVFEVAGNHTTQKQTHNANFFDELLSGAGMQGITNFDIQLTSELFSSFSFLFRIRTGSDRIGSISRLIARNSAFTFFIERLLVSNSSATRFISP